jgi:ectoine hydroxylase-related dioxygenase (phytanoyl-CoA dioxygenase family)
MADSTSIVEALALFGASPSLLSDQQEEQLDGQGFLVLEGLLSDEEITAARARFDELVISEGPLAGVEHRREPGTDRLSNLVDKGSVFDAFWTRPLQLTAIAHVLGWGEFKLSALNAREALPGQGHQDLHADWLSPVRAGAYEVCNSIWMLDEFTADNGATRVVPGSHRTGELAKDVLADPAAPHPEELLVMGKAGTCVVFNSHLWHGGTANASGARRRAIHAYFVKRHHPQQVDQQSHLGAETVRRLTAAQRYLLALSG